MTCMHFPMPNDFTAGRWRAVVRRTGSGLVAAALLAVAGACRPSGENLGSPPGSATPAGADSITREAMENATYVGIEPAGGEVTLAAGIWEGRPYEEGGATRPVVRLLGDFEVRGDLDGDGTDEAVVLLGSSGGGSGEFVYLAVVEGRGGLAKNFDTAPIGDRVQVRGARIAAGRIALDLVQAGPSDASCCPGDLVTRSWELRQRRLVEGPAVRIGRLSPESIAGTEWVLERWAEGEVAPGGVEVTLRWEDGRLVGSSGCNRYVAPVTPGDQPGALGIGPIAGTRKACPEPAMGVEDRFLRQLGAASSLRFELGRLGLVYELDGDTGVMLFRARSRP